MMPPKDDAGIQYVDLRGTITARVPETARAKNVYVIVNPLSNPFTKDWWVQESVHLASGTARCSCQFGEPSTGNGEYFAILVIATDKKYDAGERLSGIPAGVMYSKLKIVKRRGW